MWSLRRDLDPRPLPYQPQMDFKIKNKPFFEPDYDFWDNFNQFVLNQYTPDYAKDVIRQARQFHQYLISGDLSSFKLLPTEKRRRVMQSLSALSKYTGCYEQYKQMIKAYDLKWAVNNDDVIIARLIKYSGGEGNGNINEHGEVRYTDLAKLIASRGTLSLNIKELEEENLIKRKIVTTKPIQAYYSLTQKA